MIRILVEKADGSFMATARDEVGTFTVVTRPTRDAAIRVVKRRLQDLTDDEDVQVEDLS